MYTDKQKDLFRKKELLLEERMKYARNASRNDAQGVRGSSNITVDSLDKAIKDIDDEIERIKNNQKINFNYSFTAESDLLNKDTKLERPFVEDLVIGPLVYRKDGSILYKEKVLKMRPQIKTLCIFFMKNHGYSIDYSLLKDELISARKRSQTSSITISKYVSELHKTLKDCFRKDVIFNDKKEGYIFDIEEDS